MAARRLVVGIAFGIIAAVPALLASSDSVSAASGPNFVPGYIIDDSNFFNGSAMTIAQIQSFLQSQVSSCDTNGNQYFVGTYNKVTYYAPPATPNIQRKNLDSNYPAPYTCLPQYEENTTTHQNNVKGNIDGTTDPTDLPTGGACDVNPLDSTFGDGVCSAAQIIYIAQVDNNVSAKVIITTLQKEEVIVTDDWPWWVEYRSAMGYGCPDSSPGQCAASYYGFYNQVMDAAGQFDLYREHPTNYNFTVGTNQILYHPAPSSCGTETVNILDQSTAGLYDYTPYVPNQAALNNLYGLGDGCSSYGNRNFWRDYSDWFGSSVNAFMAVSSSSPQVYLIDQSVKYPVDSRDILNAYGVSGGIQTVSQTFLNGLSTGYTLGHVGKDPNGPNIYLIDSGQKVLFSSCSMMTTYGYSCGAPAMPPDVFADMSTSLIGVSSVTRSYGNGNLYEMSDGQRHYIPNYTTLNTYGLNSDPIMYLADSFLYSYPESTPLVPDQTMVFDAANGKGYLYIGGQLRWLPDYYLYEDWGFTKLPKYTFYDYLVNLLRGGADLSPFAQDSSGNKYLIDSGLRRTLGSDASDWTSTYTTGIPDALIDAIPTGSDPGSLVMSTASPSVYLVQSGQKRLIPNGDDLLRSGYSFSSITTVRSTTIDALATGIDKFGSLRLMKEASSPTVQMVDGNASWYVPSQAIAASFGFDLGSVWTVDSTTFNTYPSNGSLSSLVTDGTNYYLADRGQLFDAGSVMSNYGYVSSQFELLSSLAIQYLPKGPNLTTFVKGSSATIYEIQGGQKGPFGDYPAYVNAGGTSSNTLTLSDSYLSTLPTGATIY
jgi:hypothetical protein